MANNRKDCKKHGILHALLPGTRVDKHTKKILVRTGTSNETIIFNVGGTIFETYRTTLRSVPHSRLASDAFLQKHFRKDKKDHFFDRDPEIFHCVLNYHRTGELHLPTSVCGPVVKSELEYWGVDEIDIEECCWSRYSTWASTLKSLRKLEADRKAAEQIAKYPYKENSPPLREFCRRSWRFFSDPHSSTASQIYAYFALLIVFFSIFSFCAQTHDVFKVDEVLVIPNTTAATNLSLELAQAIETVITTATPLEFVTPDAVRDQPTSASSRAYDIEVHKVPHPVLYYLDMICLVYFIIDLTARLLVSPHKCRFLIRPMTLMEMTALVPDIVDIMTQVATSSFHEYKSVTELLYFTKVFRVFRIFRLMRHIPGLWILFYTLKASIKDLLLLLLFVGVGTLVSASLVYFAESGTQEAFSSIPKCFWWAVITMTTVGYGDMYPVTPWGYLIGTATGIAGVLMIGFTVPILVNNFVMYYTHTISTVSRERQRQAMASMSSINKLGRSLDSKSVFGGGGGLAKMWMTMNKDSNANENGYHTGDCDIPNGRRTNVRRSDDNDDDNEGANEDEALDTVEINVINEDNENNGESTHL